MDLRRAPSFLKRKPRLRAILRLNLAHLVTGKYDGMLGRAQIQTDNVFELFLEVLVVGKLEGLDAMGFETGRPPYPSDRGWTHPDLLGHRRATPVGVAFSLCSVVSLMIMERVVAEIGAMRPDLVLSFRMASIPPLVKRARHRPIFFLS